MSCGRLPDDTATAPDVPRRKDAHRARSVRRSSGFASLFIGVPFNSIERKFLA